MPTEFTPAARPDLAAPVSSLKAQIQAGLDAMTATYDAERARNAVEDRNHLRATSYGTGATITDGGFAVPAGLQAAWRAASAPAPVRDAALVLDEANEAATLLSRAAIVARAQAHAATLPSERVRLDDEASLAETAEAAANSTALRAANVLVKSAHVHRDAVLAAVPGEIVDAQHDAEEALSLLLAALDRREAGLDLLGRTEQHPLRSVPGLGSRWPQSRLDLVAFVGGTR